METLENEIRDTDRADRREIAEAAVIRNATEADIPAVAAIYAHHVRHGLASFEEKPPSAKEMLRRFRALNDQGMPYIVAETRAGLVAYAYAGPYRARPAYRHSVENAVYIDPDWTGLGLGGKLLPLIIERCTEMGFRQMIAIIGDSENHASIRLHARHGFHPTGTLHSVGHKHGRWVDTVIMQRALGPGDSTPPCRD